MVKKYKYFVTLPIFICLLLTSVTFLHKYLYFYLCFLSFGPILEFSLLCPSCSTIQRHSSIRSNRPRSVARGKQTWKSCLKLLDRKNNSFRMLCKRCLPNRQEVLVFHNSPSNSKNHVEVLLHSVDRRWLAVAY